MTLPLTELAATVFAGHDAGGNAREVENGQAVVWGTEIERFIEAAFGVSTSVQGGWDASAGTFPGSGTATKGQTWFVTTAGTVGGVSFRVGDRVVALATNASTTVYAGNWIRVASAIDPIVAATDAGAGTANAIEVTATRPVAADGGQMISFAVFEPNTSSTVTVAITDGDGTELGPFTVKTAAGNSPVVGGLPAGYAFVGQIVGSEIRLLSDQASAAVQAACEAAAESIIERWLGAHASDAAATAAAGGTPAEGAKYFNTSSVKERIYLSGVWTDVVGVNNRVADEFTGDDTDDPLTLSGDPGTVYNLDIYIEGLGPQPSPIFTLNGLELSPPAGAVWPLGKKIYVLRGTAIAVNTPAAGSVGANELSANAIADKTHAAAEKATVHDDDEMGGADSEASYGFVFWKFSTWKAAIWTALGALIAGGTDKATPVDADTFAISDSAASNASKKVSFANLKATLKTYFDTIYGGLTIGALTATNTGALNYTKSIPAGVKSFKIHLRGVSTNGTSLVMLHLRTAAAIISSGYNGGGLFVTGTNACGLFANNTAGVPTTGGAATATRNAVIEFNLIDETNNIWSYRADSYDSTNNYSANAAGTVALPAAATGVVLYTVNGTDTFDAGSWVMTY